MFCKQCAGSGKVFGNGMVSQDCKRCLGTGHYVESSESTSRFIDKRSKHYKSAIKEIMELNPDITHSQATKMFDDAYNDV